MADRKREVSVAADTPHSISVEYTVFIIKIACESVERYRVKSDFRKPDLRPVQNPRPVSSYHTDTHLQS
jgi:hypothetical protein